MKFISSLIIALMLISFFPTSRVSAKEPVQNRISAKRQERINAFANQMILRLEANTKRLEKLALRVESRISKIKDKNKQKDLKLAQANVDEAKKKLTSASQKIEELKNSLETTNISENPKDTFMLIKKSISEIKKDLKEVHLLLVKAVQKIKDEK